MDGWERSRAGEGLRLEEEGNADKRGWLVSGRRESHVPFQAEVVLGRGPVWRLGRKAPHGLSSLFFVLLFFFSDFYFIS
jgi:hypothetical protein